MKPVLSSLSVPMIIIRVMSVGFHLYASREGMECMNLYNHHIVYGDGLGELVYWSMLELRCQKSHLMLEVKINEGVGQKIFVNEWTFQL